MRRFALTVSLCLLPLTAFAGPAEGYFQNDKGSVLHITTAEADGFDFTLTAGASDGAATCPEGATDCLQIEGHADAGGRGFVHIDPDDDRSRVFFGEDAKRGIKVLSTTGDLGTGSANRAQMLALTGAYKATDAVQTDGGMQAGDATDAGFDELHAFKSPTGNIACLFSVGATTTVRCDLAQLNRSFTTAPKDCDLEWGDSFEISSGARRGALGCHGDTVIDPQAEVLDYGSTLRFGDIACVSSKAGMTCRTAQGHGFTVSRKMQSLF